LAGLVVLVTVLGYAVSLVGVPEGIADNAEPPTLAMVAGTVWLVGMALALRPAGLRWLEHRRRRRATAAVHRVLLTIYLWHITALMVSAGLWHAVGLPEPEIGSASWWALRPVWVLAALVPLVALVAAWGRFEAHPVMPEGPEPRRPLTAPIAALGVFAVSVGLLGFGETGFLPLAPVQGEAVLMFDFNPVQNVVHLLVGAMLLWAVSRGALHMPALGVGIGVFLVLGAGHLAGLADRLGMNRASAIAHLAAGVVSLAGALVAGLRLRRRAAAGSGA
jgi:hypothetical protein